MTTKQAIKYLNLYIKINDKRAIPLTKAELKFKLEEDFTQKISEAINLLLEDNTRLDKENQKLFEENLFKEQIINEMAHWIDGTGETPNEVAEQYKFGMDTSKYYDLLKDYFYKKVGEQK